MRSACRPRRPSNHRSSSCSGLPFSPAARPFPGQSSTWSAMPFSAVWRRWQRSAFIVLRAWRAWAAASCWVCSVIDFGAKPVLIAGLLVQALAIGSYAFVSRLGEFYVLAVIFGTAYGGVMPLYAVLAREYFGQHIMGTVFGAATMLSSLGMAFGPLAGGWIFDTFDAYTWLFFVSFAVGLGAVTVALAFPPAPRAQLQPA